jgi:hypothetical protein
MATFFICLSSKAYNAHLICFSADCALVQFKMIEHNRLVIYVCRHGNW